VPEGHGLPVSEGHARKKDPFINKKERDTLSIDTQKALKHYEQLKPDQPYNKSDVEKLTTLINQYDITTITEAITLHVNEPDQWTKERGSSLATLRHNLPSYLEKIGKRREEQQRNAAAAEANRQRLEQYRQEEEQAARERAEYEALPEEEKERRRAENKRLLAEAVAEARNQAKEA